MENNTLIDKIQQITNLKLVLRVINVKDKLGKESDKVTI